MFTNLSPTALGITTDLAGTIALASRHGWNGCDLPMDEAMQLAATTSPEHVAALFSEASLRLGGWRLPLNWVERYSEADLAGLGRQAALASTLGCTRVFRSVKSISDERPFRENFAFQVAQLQPIARVLMEHGCRLALEFIGPRTKRETGRYGFIHSLDAMLCLVEAIGSNTGLLLDSWHWYTSLGSLADIRSLRESDVVYVHISDAPAGVAMEKHLDRARELPGATGVIDNVGLLRTLRELGYDGPVTPEPFGQPLATLSPDEACRVVHEQVRDILSRSMAGDSA